MEIKINKEIRDYTESVFFGLSLRQFACALGAVGAAVGCYFGLRNILGTDITTWICLFAAAPFAALGFVKYNGMRVLFASRPSLTSNLRFGLCIGANV